MKLMFKHSGSNFNPFKCCLGCTERRVGCHSRCPKYQEGVQKNLDFHKKVFTENLQVKGGINSRKQTGDYSF